jgi:hypothetical protein
LKVDADWKGSLPSCSVVTCTGVVTPPAGVKPELKAVHVVHSVSSGKLVLPPLYLPIMSGLFPPSA